MDGTARSAVLVDDLRARIAWTIGEIDLAVSRQLDAVLAHPAFCALEREWRGLRYLCEAVAGAIEDAGGAGYGRAAIGIRLIYGFGKPEILKDAATSTDFDQSVLFERIYSGFDSPAGVPDPFGMLVADMEFDVVPEDVYVLGHVAGVAAASFAPFVAGASPRIFGGSSFSELESQSRIDGFRTRPDAGQFREFRRTDDAKFIALALPRIVLRRPHPEGWIAIPRLRCKNPNCRADLREVVGWRCSNPECGREFLLSDPSTYRDETLAFHYRPNPRDSAGGYLFGNAAWAVAAVAARSFAFSGWLADIRGARERVAGGGRPSVADEPASDPEHRGGLVGGLRTASYGTDSPGVAWRPTTDVVITDEVEREIARFGFIPVCSVKNSTWAVIYSTPSIQAPTEYDTAEAAASARISGLLESVLCASRFAHYLKALGREKVGSNQDAETIQRDLNNWLNEFVDATENPTEDSKAEKPLRNGRVEVKESAREPGRFDCILHLEAHPRIDRIGASITLTTALRSA